jgi:hypothetical protein
VGNYAAATNEQVLANRGIYVVVSVTGVIEPSPALGIGKLVEGIFYDDLVLPSVGPTSDEYGRYLEALDKVSETLAGYHADTIMVVCYDGKAVCLPAVSYHLRASGRPITDYITIYMRPELARDELLELEALAKPDALAPDIGKTKEERLALRGFSAMSYRELYKHYPAKKPVTRSPAVRGVQKTV